jgi:streptogramin lyase
MQLNVPVTGDSVAGLADVEVQFEYAGTTQVQKFSSQTTPSLTANLVATFDWNGLDRYGAALPSRGMAHVTVKYRMANTYQAPSTFGGRSFMLTTGNLVPLQTDSRTLYTVVRKYSVPFGRNTLNHKQDLAGWTPAIHHHYEPKTQTMLLGNGEVWKPTESEFDLTDFAGTGQIGFNGDNGSATTAKLSDPWGMVMDAKGNIYFNDFGNFRIRKVDPSGVITTIAGTGIAGFSGDGGPATSAQIRMLNSSRLTIGLDGSLYFADTGNNRIRKIDTNGIITTFAGGATSGLGDNGPATAARLAAPRGVFASPDGSIYIDDSLNHRIRRVMPNGIITTMAGTGVAGYSGDGGPAQLAQLNDPYVVAMGTDGELYVADHMNRVVRVIDPNGKIRTFAGTGLTGYSGDGGPALTATFGNINPANGESTGGPTHVELNEKNEVYVADPYNNALRKIDRNGIIRTLVGPANLSFPSTSLMLPSGGLLIANPQGAKIKKFASRLPDWNAVGYEIRSKDNAEIFVFNANGKHLKTLNASDRSLKWEFQYDSDGRLALIQNTTGAVATIVRNGNSVSITGADQGLTQINLDGNGHIANVNAANGQSYVMKFGATGLLEELNRVGVAITSYAYNSDGEQVAHAPPVVTANLVSNQRTNNPTFTIHIAHELPTFTTVKRSGVTVLTTTERDLSFTLNTGSNDFIVDVVDEQGVHEVKTFSNLVLDQVQPQLAVTSPGSVLSNQNPALVTVTGTSNEELGAIEVAGVAGSVGEDQKSFTVTVPVTSAGTFGFNVKGTDLAGNVSELTVPITVGIDTVAPVVTLTYDGPTTVASKYIHLGVQTTETSSPWVEVYLNHEKTFVSRNKNLDLGIFFPSPGPNLIEVIATDEAGNVSEKKSLSIIWDNTPLQLTIVSPANLSEHPIGPVAVVIKGSRPLAFATMTSGILTPIDSEKMTYSGTVTTTTDGLVEIAITVRDYWGNPAQAVLKLNIQNSALVAWGYKECDGN